MKLLAAAAALLALALAPGCDRMLMPAAPVNYAPWEVGLTLGFENPSLPESQRPADRFQLRVKEARMGTGGRIVIEAATTLGGQTEMTFLQKDGGVIVGTDPEGKLRLLPKGFPDRVSRWEDRGTLHWVVGRAAVQLPGVRFADDNPPIGVWVESAPAAGEGARNRTLYLPDIGEAETLLWKDGHWVCVFRLVSRGFTDAPAALAKAAQ